MGTLKRYSKPSREQVLECLELRETFKEIGARFGYSPSGMRRYTMVLLGLEEYKRRLPGVHKELRAKVYAILDAEPDKLPEEIAEEAPCHIETVWRYIRERTEASLRRDNIPKCPGCDTYEEWDNPHIDGVCMLCCFRKLRIRSLTFFEDGGVELLRYRRDELEDQVRGMLQDVEWFPSELPFLKEVV